LGGGGGKRKPLLANRARYHNGTGEKEAREKVKKERRRRKRKEKKPQTDRYRIVSPGGPVPASGVR